MDVSPALAMEQSTETILRKLAQQAGLTQAPKAEYFMRTCPKNIKANKINRCPLRIEDVGDHVVVGYLDYCTWSDPSGKAL